MRNDDIRELSDDFEVSGLDERAKAQVRRVLRKFASKHGLSAFDKDDQIAFIQHLRRLQEPAPIIKARLMARYGISKTTAYERIAEASQLSGKLAIFRTLVGLNQTMEVGLETSAEDRQRDKERTKMVELVYFGEELNKRAPGVGIFYCGTTHRWMSGDAAVEALRSGESVTLRPATESEMQTASAIADLHVLGDQLLSSAAAFNSPRRN